MQARGTWSRGPGSVASGSSPADHRAGLGQRERSSPHRADPVRAIRARSNPAHERAIAQGLLDADPSAKRINELSPQCAERVGTVRLRRGA